MAPEADKGSKSKGGGRVRPLRAREQTTSPNPRHPHGRSNGGKPGTAKKPKTAPDGTMKRPYELDSTAEPGDMPFFPDFSIREATAAFGYLLILVLLAALTTPGLEEMADPNASGVIPRPEWYFLWLFEMLKYFPGELEVVGAVILPGIGFGVLVGLPFLDRWARRPRTFSLLPGTRAIRVAPRLGAVIVLLGIGYLTLRGVQSHVPTADKGPVLTAVQEAGADLYQKMGCPTCHAVDGEGGRRGRDLTHFAAKSDAQKRVLLHFAGVQPASGSEMPAYQLSPEELRSLSEYLLTFK